MDKKMFIYTKKELCDKLNSVDNYESLSGYNLQEEDILAVYDVTKTMSHEEINRNIENYDGKRPIYCIEIADVDSKVYMNKSGVYEDENGYYMIYSRPYLEMD